MSALRDRQHVLDVMLAAARRASELVMRIYAEPFAVEYKAADDPVTRADKEANALLVDALARAFPGVVIVAEESDASTFAGYPSAREAFFVDPIDGTREFVAKNGEFCIMLGFAEEGRATTGLVLCPAFGPAPFGDAYLGAEGLGAHRISGASEPTAIRVSGETAATGARVVVSRSHRAKEADAFFERLGVRTLVPTGSSGIKAARVAEAAADVYLQPGRSGKLWDACAPEAIVRAAGGIYTDLSGAAFDYRRPVLELDRGVLATNGALHPLFRDAFRAEYEAWVAREAAAKAAASGRGEP